MDRLHFGKNIVSQLLVMSFILSGCLPSDVPTSKNLATSLENSNCPQGQQCVGGETTGGSLGSGTSLPPKVEIRHLIEPNLSTDANYSTAIGTMGGGSYVRKLTIPKNFAGRLYLAGINFGTLSSRIVRVRFRFGVSRDPITIPATVTQAPGITPQTPISVLVMDLRSAPFRDVRLPYDLFDYNDYTVNQDGSWTPEPIQENRNTGLYCRGLRLEDDPTFNGVGKCDGAEDVPGQDPEQCLYAYAKVLDQGLVKETLNAKNELVKLPLMPTFPQIKSTAGANYILDTMSQKFLKPLPDLVPYVVSGAIRIPTSFIFSGSGASLASTDPDSKSASMTFDPWGPVTYDSVRYWYRGPYRLVNTPNWEFGFRLDQLDGKKKLFREGSFVHYTDWATDPLPDDFPLTATVSSDKRQKLLYFKSYLFPLATKLDLTANVSHLSSAVPDTQRDVNILATGGKTLWMDGSNARAQSRNADLEHVGSCNVTALMEIIAKDDNGIDYVIANSKDVKLQLVRPTQYRTDTGNEVLYTNFKACTPSGGCGSSECCFNNRCWDQSLVSQCPDATSLQGNRTIGESCATDLECTSLCCNRTSGQCSPHNTILSPQVLCSKPVGDFCIAKEWCAKSTVIKCLVVKTGTDTSGNTTCRQQCFYEQQYSDCKNGVCIPPEQQTISAFDPTDPNACSGAVPPPSF